jgi:multidrug efflux system membrane fusion protein
MSQLSFYRPRYSHRRGVLLLALLLAAPGACHRAERAPRTRPPVPVTAERAVIDSLPVNIEAVGTVTPMATVDIRSRIDGRLERVYFKEGDLVEAGEHLFDIDPRPYRAVLAQATATQARDEAQARTAYTEERRYRRLLERGLVSSQEYEQRATQARALSATVAADRAAVVSARVNLGYTRINAPISGKTGSLQVTAGNLVKANDTTLVGIRQISPIYVTFAVPSEHLPAIRRRTNLTEDSKVLSVYAAAPGAPESDVRQGILTFIDNSVDTSTGTIALKATFANRDHSLWPGQFVNARLLLDRKDGVVVPAQALQTGQRGDYVFVVGSNMTAESRVVRVGVRDGERIAIEAGVQPGELVVTDGQLGLVPGAPVELRPEPHAESSWSGLWSESRPGT